MSFLIENRERTWRYALVWIPYILLHMVSLKYLSATLPLWAIGVDAFVHALLFGVFGVLLWNMMQYGNYDKIPAFQRTVNYSALALVLLVLWIGLGYGLAYLFFGKEYAVCFLPFFPFYIFVGILIYLLHVFYFRNCLFLQKVEEELAELVPDLTALSASEESVDEQPDANVEVLERIAVKSGVKIHVILVSEIVYLQADGDYVRIFTENGKFLKEQTMKYFEENLPVSQFVRVHRSYIVNIGCISRVEQYEKQNQLLTLKNGDKIKASIAGYKNLRKKLGL
ncbi:LytTR family transcriptional regulator [Paludibacter sp. 221]|uniref:LytR/AlgR family response regulator transcription factor n=1 Tax=Paludibacter sp. 221 TaxID=2302939 RepID=UPI0013D6D70D|nr:LytTR family DNA-binding domain-containing protein [Paludibacter sp. 221]NDV45622.1 LytTR family transcriptional regulator [Paludibacter sp. 221]